MPMLPVGSSAPDFTVFNHRGEAITLSALRGRPVVLWFYPKADTPGCTVEGCSLRDTFHQFADKGALVFGVSFDTIAENRDFAAKFAFPFDLLCDTERTIGILYGAADSPTSANARRISYLIGTDGKIERAWEKVDVKSHANDLLAAL